MPHKLKRRLCYHGRVTQRLMIFDRTCRGRALLPGLSHAWTLGSWVYRGLRRFDAYCGVESWEEAFDWLLARSEHQPIAEVQFWGHGKWGCARVGEQAFDRTSLCAAHPLAARVGSLRDRMQGAAPGESPLWWFRTCETLGARPGQDFAAHLGDVLGSRIAGHTYIIATWQSGLHSLAPGTCPDWSPEEGLKQGSAEEPRQAHWSGPKHPHTIHCLQGKIPTGY